MLFRELNRDKCKTYLLACEQTRKAVLIDPLKDSVGRYIAVLAYYGCHLEYVVDTHTHADHRTGAWDLRDLVGARVVMHQRAPAPHIDVHVEDGQQIAVGGVHLHGAAHARPHPRQHQPLHWRSRLHRRHAAHPRHRPRRLRRRRSWRPVRQHHGQAVHAARRHAGLPGARLSRPRALDHRRREGAQPAASPDTRARRTSS